MRASYHVAFSRSGPRGHEHEFLGMVYDRGGTIWLSGSAFRGRSRDVIARDFREVGFAYLVSSLRPLAQLSPYEVHPVGPTFAATLVIETATGDQVTSRTTGPFWRVWDKHLMRDTIDLRQILSEACPYRDRREREAQVRSFYFVEAGHFLLDAHWSEPKTGVSDRR